MQRSSVIATVVATGGILIAGSVASVAVINAAATSSPEATTVTLVAAEEPVIDPVGDPVGDAVAVPPVDGTRDGVPAELAPVAAEPLPALPQVDQSTRPSRADDGEARADNRDDSSDDTPRASSTPKASDQPRATAAAQQAGITSAQARATVLDQGKGVSVVSVSKDSRQGLATWAVRITRSNGEVITGYVDRASGVVVDWVVNSGPTPAPQPTASYDDDDDSHDDDDDDSHDDDDDDRDEDYDDDGKDDDD